ncbi:MAG TPA: thioredoxin domain-containing protein [Aquaticitalea sp.]|nr:thioredoxin domain-containing protein [Aquaticitalea sp.]
MQKPTHNKLASESSPYLLQHAHNPVNWYPWNDEALALAKQQNKLIIISIGYAACHWCHVMESESFEDQDVAEVMNTHYLSIKVDREERPDIDQVYMGALQLMTGQGGWPLNVVALPDGRPIWGGTYFRKEQWISALEQVQELYQKNRLKLLEYATRLEQGLKTLDTIIPNQNEPEFDIGFIANAIKTWSVQFDHQQGGTKGAPKFMMPNNYQFLLRFAYQTNDNSLMDYVNLTLEKMAFGGINDAIGGGFARYAIDDRWHVPHFEKMLYDNALMASLYADAYSATKRPLYKETLESILDFVKNELSGTEGNFYASLDADSLNEIGKMQEGAYYVWQKESLKSILKTNGFELFSDYYNINETGHWEHGNYVLIRSEADSSFIKKHDISIKTLDEQKKTWKQALLQARNKRKKPRLDDKNLASWNALMAKGFLDAYRVLKKSEYLDIAKKNAAFILKAFLQEDGSLMHSYKNGKSTINGYLEDYATAIDLFSTLYEQTLEQQWLITARNLANYTLDHFFDERSGMFFFTSDTDTPLITRPIEYRDNVMASSNSIMAKNLFRLAHFFDNAHYLNVSIRMLNNVKSESTDYASGFSNWLDLMLNFSEPFYQIVITGQAALEKITELNQVYIPNKVLSGSKTLENLPILANKLVADKTMIYVCQNKTCKMPTEHTEKAIEQLNIRT